MEWMRLTLTHGMPLEYEQNSGDPEADKRQYKIRLVNHNKDPCFPLKLHLPLALEFFIKHSFLVSSASG
jgi:hypothetical protein